MAWDSDSQNREKLGSIAILTPWGLCTFTVRYQDEWKVVCLDKEELIAHTAPAIYACHTSYSTGLE